jgi:signal transduction histidine kinase
VVGSGSPPEAIPIAAQDVIHKDGDLVCIEATVLNGLSQPEQDIVMLQDGPSIFRATLLRKHGALPLQDLPSGTHVQLTGICAVTAGNVQGYLTRMRPETFRIVLRSPGDVRVITPAPWLTREWVVKASIILAAILIVAFSWVLFWTLLSARKNRQLLLQVAATRAAEDELQKAHDELELRVQQRTRELHAQITARQETEVRFAAISTERARLARELHDSLEQVLTGTALQLNAASEMIHVDPSAASEHIKIARSLMRQTRTEVRRSVWDLRAQSLETHDLGQALQKAAEHLIGTGVELQVTTSGKALRLTDVLENHLLRIGQEAVTNAVKHGKAGRILLHLDFCTDNVRMTVEDDGRGFEVEAVLGVAHGHFGLQGMRERVKRMGGTLQLESLPGAGAKLTVETPLEPHLLETYSA